MTGTCDRNVTGIVTRSVTATVIRIMTGIVTVIVTVTGTLDRNCDNVWPERDRDFLVEELS